MSERGVNPGRERSEPEPETSTENRGEKNVKNRVKKMPKTGKICSKNAEGQKAQRSTSTISPGTIAEASGRVAYPQTLSEGSTGLQGAMALKLKLRNQAKKLGLVPGTDAWRAYVLGTFSAMKRRKQLSTENQFRPV
jgi:hypothetical protein